MASVTLAIIIVFCLLTPQLATAEILQDTLFGGRYEFIDLSYSFDNFTVYWPGSEKFHFTKKTEKVERWYAANDFTAGEHGGTHIDAPYHFNKTGQYVSELSMNKLIAPMVIVNISSKVNGNPDFVLNKTHLVEMGTGLSDRLKKLCVLIINFGWSKYYHEDKYLGFNGTTMRFPGISEDAAEWIVKFKNVVGVGVDTSSVDAGEVSDYPAHTTFARAGLYNMENINLGSAPVNDNCTALVLPMKIGTGTGAPLRLVAVCPIKEEVPAACKCLN